MIIQTSFLVWFVTTDKFIGFNGGVGVCSEDATVLSS